jgi:Lar family restriction alleviation protein
MNEELKPCPFCGSAEYLTAKKPDGWQGDTAYVRCISCDCQMFGSDTADAGMRWNKREPPKSISDDTSDDY